MSLNDLTGNGGGTAAPSSSVDPAEYARLLAHANELEQRYGETQEFLQRLSPHAERIKRLLEDEAAAQIYDNSFKAYDAVREDAKPKLGPEWDPKVNPYLEKIEKVAAIAEQMSTRSQEYEQKQKEEVNQRLLEENYKFSEGLLKQYPNLAENDCAGLGMIAKYAADNNLSLPEAAKRTEHIYRGSQVEPNLRAGVGDTGVPGPSKTEGGDAGFTQRAAQLIRHYQKTAGAR